MHALHARAFAALLTVRKNYLAHIVR